MPFCDFLRSKQDAPILFHAPFKRCAIIQVCDDGLGPGYRAGAGVHRFYFPGCIRIKGNKPDLFRVCPDLVNPKPVLVNMEEHVTLLCISAWHGSLMQDISGVRRYTAQPKLIPAPVHGPGPLALLVPVRLPFAVCIFRFGDLQHGAFDDIAGIQVLLGDGYLGRLILDVQDASPDTVIRIVEHTAGISVAVL